MSDPAAAAAAKAAQLAALQHRAAYALIAPVTVAALIGCCMSGGVVALAIIYAVRYPRDRWPFKALVGFLAVLTVWDTAVEAAWVWRWAIQGFSDLTIMRDITPVHFSLSAMNIGITELFVQSFFIWRVWIISSRKSGILCAVQAGLMLLAVSTVMVVSAKGYTSATNEEISVFRPIAILRLASGVAADCLITASLTYYLVIKPRSTGAPIYSSNLQRIVAQAFTTNLVTGIVQIATLILLAADKSSCRFTIPSFTEVKVMVMCLFATLLSRPATSSGFSESGEPSSSGAYLSHNKRNTFVRNQTNGATGLTSVRVDIDTHVNVDHGIDLESDEFGSPRSSPGSIGPKSPYKVTFTGGGNQGEKSYNEKAAKEEEMEMKPF